MSVVSIEFMIDKMIEILLNWVELYRVWRVEDQEQNLEEHRREVQREEIWGHWYQQLKNEMKGKTESRIRQCQWNQTKIWVDVEEC